MGFVYREGHSLHTEVVGSHPAVINVQNDLVIINGCADNLEESRPRDMSHSSLLLCSGGLSRLQLGSNSSQFPFSVTFLFK